MRKTGNRHRRSAWSAWAVGPLGALALTLTLSTAVAEPRDLEVDPVTLEEAYTAVSSSASLPGSWRRLDVPGKKMAEFRVLESGAVEVRSDGAVGFLVRPVDSVEQVRSTLRWRWKVEETGPLTDLARQGGDDRPLAVHVWFPKDPDEIGFWDSLKRTAADLMGYPLPGKVLTYVWGGQQERGAKFANPYLDGDGAIIVLRPGSSEPRRWYEEDIDFRADFQMAFGYAPPAPSFVAVSADSDDLGGRTAGRIVGLEFGG